MLSRCDLYDIAVIGAGPAGCVTALSFARKGARVLLLEAQPNVSSRLAGEWIHPPGAEILNSLGIISLLPSSTQRAGHGFAIFPEDKTEPIVLEYPGGATGLSCEHALLVNTLRQAARGQGAIEFLEDARVTEIDGNALTFVRQSDASSRTIQAGMIVGADGRHSIVRRSAGISDRPVSISVMAGVLLNDADLPFEGFGHVLLGGPGPALIYRIGPHSVRACLDVPLGNRQEKDSAAYLWDSFRAVMPEALLPALRHSLKTRPVQWAVNQFRSRDHYGRDGMALVGDAVGCFHPLTAVGMTLGFQDGECLARSQSFSNYCQERRAATHVPEMLANALYEVCAKETECELALRGAICRLWRQSASDRARTMRLLSGEQTAVREFGKVAMKVVGMAAKGSVKEAVSPRRWRHSAHTLSGLGRWMKWLEAGALPRIGSISAPK